MKNWSERELRFKLASMKRPLPFFAFFSVALLLMSGCNLFETVDGTEVQPGEDMSITLPDMASDVGDTPNNLPPDMAEKDAETQPDLVQDAGVDMSPDMGEFCECQDPAATCTNDGCQLELACDPMVNRPECPEDYFCNAGESCECDEAASCGTSCRTTEDCPDQSICLSSLGYCIEEKRCFSDATCPEGSRCTYPNGFDVLGVCRRSGTKAVNTPCRTDIECESGSCVDSVCVQTCRSQIDCPEDGQSCIEFRFGSSSICSINESCNCDLDEVCGRDECKESNTICVAGACRANEVCDLFDESCQSLPCEVDEYAYREDRFNDRVYCIDTSASCYSDADCGPSQACVMVNTFQVELYENPSEIDFSRSVNACARIVQ